jgi:hypothetical protein
VGITCQGSSSLTDDLLRDLMAAENGLVGLCSAYGNDVAVAGSRVAHSRSQLPHCTSTLAFWHL